MGSYTKAWGCFHKACGHDTEHCYTLTKQIEELLKRGLLQIFKARMEEENEARPKGVKKDSVKRGERDNQEVERHER